LPAGRGSNVVTHGSGSNRPADRLSGRGPRRIPDPRRRRAVGVGASLMVLRGARCRSIGGWLAAASVGSVIAIGLAGCSPIDSYRSFVGVSLNDPDPKTSPFTQNLAAGEVMNYPNLATVPPPPTRATTTAERQKLTEALVANRTETEASASPTAPLPANVALA